MSFWTDFQYVRTAPPPAVTTADLAAFCRAVLATGMVQPNTLGGRVKVAFGDAIDQDGEPAESWEESDIGVSRMVSINYDIDQKVDLDSVPALLESTPGTIYRAQLSFGIVAEALFEAVARQADRRNSQPLLPSDLSLTIGPVMAGDIQTDFVAHVGWISLTLSGPGYLYPWTLRTWVARAASQPQVQSLMQLCETTWPAPALPPSREVQALRRELGTLFPYSPKTPLSWWWTVMETG